MEKRNKRRIISSDIIKHSINQYRISGNVNLKMFISTKILVRFNDPFLRIFGREITTKYVRATSQEETTLTFWPIENILKQIKLLLVKGNDTTITFEIYKIPQG